MLVCVLIDPIGTVIVMIGASLIGSSGIPNWGGGSNDCQSRPTSGIFQLCRLCRLGRGIFVWNSLVHLYSSVSVSSHSVGLQLITRS